MTPKSSRQQQQHTAENNQSYTHTIIMTIVYTIAASLFWFWSNSMSWLSCWVGMFPLGQELPMWINNYRIVATTIDDSTDTARSGWFFVSKQRHFSRETTTTTTMTNENDVDMMRRALQLQHYWLALNWPRWDSVAPFWVPSFPKNPWCASWRVCPFLSFRWCFGAPTCMGLALWDMEQRSEVVVIIMGSSYRMNRLPSCTGTLSGIAFVRSFSFDQ